MNGLTRLAFVISGLAVIARLFFLDGPIDEPAWRQAENAYVAYRMMSESPPAVLHPKTVNRGMEDVRLNEIPLHGLLVALAYKAVGGESLAVARSVTLVTFLFAAFYFYAAVKLVFSRQIASAAVAIYCLIPLGIFYSRAMHYDFMILWFAHGATYHFLVGIRDGKRMHVAVALLYAALTGLMKIPYLACLFPLAGGLILDRARAGNWWPAAAAAALLVLAAAVSFGVDRYRISMELGHSDSAVYPQKMTKEFQREFFLGTWGDRLDKGRWRVAYDRWTWLVLTPAGILAALAGLLSPALRRTSASSWSWLALLAGTGVYILVFFKMVASPHDYYSLPLMAPAAIAAAGALCWRERWASPALAMLAAAMLAGGARGFHEFGYFRHDWQRLEAGAAIKAHTEAQDLVVSSADGRSTGWTDPRILYYADRRGWCMDLQSLNADMLAAYRSAGARYLALLVTPEAAQHEESRALLAAFPNESFALKDPDGQAIGSLILYHL